MPPHLKKQGGIKADAGSPSHRRAHRIKAKMQLKAIISKLSACEYGEYDHEKQQNMFSFQKQTFV